MMHPVTLCALYDELLTVCVGDWVGERPTGPVQYAAQCALLEQY